MPNEPDLDLLASRLTVAGRKLLTAEASNMEEANGILRDLGEDLLHAAESLERDDDQTTDVKKVL